MTPHPKPLTRDEPREWFSYDPDRGLEFHKSESEARDAADRCIDEYRDCCDPGWPEEVEHVCIGIVTARVVEQMIREPGTNDADDIGAVDYELEVANGVEREVVVRDGELPANAIVYADQCLCCGTRGMCNCKRRPSADSEVLQAAERWRSLRPSAFDDNNSAVAYMHACSELQDAVDTRSKGAR